jgi:tetratricopeptide (TPR) repeat protein
MKKKATLFLLFVSVVQVFSAFSQEAGAGKVAAVAAFNKATVEVNAQRYDEGLTLLNKSISMNPNYDLALIERGKLLLVKGKTSEAQKDFQSAIKLNTSNGEAYWGKGLVELTQNDANAVTSFTTAIQMGFAKAQVYYYRGVAKMKQKDFSGAMGDFTQAIDLKKAYAEAYNERGLTKQNLNDLMGAESDFKNAIKSDSTSYIAYINLAYLYSNKGDHDKAIELVSIPVAKQKNSSEWLFERANIYLRAKKFEEAEKDYANALKLSESAIGYINYANCLAQQNKYTESFAALDKASALAPKNTDVNLMRGKVFELKGNFKEACKQWQIAAEGQNAEAAAYFSECKK